MHKAIESIEKAQIISVDFDGVIMSFLFGRAWKTGTSNPKGWFFPIERAFTGFFHRFRYEIPKCKETLLKLKKKGKKLYVLTIRNPFTAMLAQKWLKSHGFDGIFDGFYSAGFVANAAEFKSQIIRENNIDLHIDDDISVISGLDKLLPANRNLILFHSKENIDSKRVFKVEDWIGLIKDL